METATCSFDWESYEVGVNRNLDTKFEVVYTIDRNESDRRAAGRETMRTRSLNGIEYWQCTMCSFWNRAFWKLCYHCETHRPDEAKQQEILTPSSGCAIL